MVGAPAAVEVPSRSSASGVQARSAATASAEERNVQVVWGAGSAVTDLVAESFPECCLDCGEVPENYLGAITSRAPMRVLFVDAVEFGGEVGEARMCDWSSVGRYGWDTHRFPLRAVAQYLANEGGMEVALLGVQPGRIEFGAEMSAAMQAGVGAVSGLITGALWAASVPCAEAKWL